MRGKGVWAAGALALVLAPGLRRAEAQTTFRDVPSDPRSLFYRPDGSATPRANTPYAVPPPRSVVDDLRGGFMVQDPRPFTTQIVPGVPKHPPGAQYLWPGGLFYRQGHHWRRPPIHPAYFNYHRIAPQTQCWP